MNVVRLPYKDSIIRDVYNDTRTINTIIFIRDKLTLRNKATFFEFHIYVSCFQIDLQVLLQCFKFRIR